MCTEDRDELLQEYFTDAIFSCERARATLSGWLELHPPRNTSDYDYYFFNLIDDKIDELLQTILGSAFYETAISASKLRASLKRRWEEEFNELATNPPAPHFDGHLTGVRLWVEHCSIANVPSLLADHE